jgi:ketosteroid isomerase-like protein
MSDSAGSQDVTTRWIQGYLGAWSSNEPDQIEALFAEDAEYFTEPYAEPWRGHSEIVEGWLETADEPDSFTFDWSPVSITDDLSIVRGTTAYTDGPTYSNLWVIRFTEDGRAREFTEWWMDQTESSGSN